MGKPVRARFFLGVTAWVAVALAPGALGARQVEQAPAPAAKSHLRQALPRRQYLCAEGISIVVLLEPNAVRLTFNGLVHNMKQIESDSGSKYSDGSLVWSVQGDYASLEDVSIKDKPKYLAQICVLQGAYPPTAPSAGKVVGLIVYPQGMVLPPEAQLIVEVRDVSLADAPSPTEAQQTIPVGQLQGPIPFELVVDPSKIDATHRYAMEARVLVGGRICATNDKQYLVLTQGNPNKVEIALIAVDAAVPPKR